MIYFSFKNYDEFKEKFGVQEHGNGVKSRKNKILLSLLKNKDYLHKVVSAKETWEIHHMYHYGEERDKFSHYTRWHVGRELPFGVNLLECRNLAELREKLYAIMQSDMKRYFLSLNGRTFYSNVFSTDDFKGVCEDGDESSIRYVNNERDRVFKMKAGKFFRKLVEEVDGLDSIISEQVKIWLCEQFAEEWKAYASQFSAEYDLHVDEAFDDIYNGRILDGNFHSCMVGRDYDNFYSEAVTAKAAYLTKKGAELGDTDSIVARCIIFPEVHVYGSDQVLRLAERQYATDCSDKLKRQLVMSLIEAGEIDGYKRIGADCGDARGFVDIHGNPLPSTDLWIDCEVRCCNVSYQDSFKYYDEDERRAYNSEAHSYTHKMDVTDGCLEGNHDNDYWSSWNDEYIPEDEACYVDTRDDYFWYNQTVTAYVQRNGRRFEEHCFEEDCVEIDGDYYYAGDNADDPNYYGIYECPKCGNYFIAENGVYSELTDEDYCCQDCLEEAETDYREDNGWAFSDWDGEWYEDADEVVKAKRWVQRYSWQHGCFMGRYEETTIHIESLNDLIESGDATYVNDIAYIDVIGFDGEPVHIAAAEIAA